MYKEYLRDVAENYASLISKCRFLDRENEAVGFGRLLLNWASGCDSAEEGMALIRANESERELYLLLLATKGEVEEFDFLCAILVELVDKDRIREAAIAVSFLSELAVEQPEKVSFMTNLLNTVFDEE